MRGKRKTTGLKTVSQWMTSRQRRPFPFQRATWKAMLQGKSGILHSPTGTGKTLAIWLGAIARWLDRTDADALAQQQARIEKASKRTVRNHYAPIQVIWLTPLRALAADTLLALQEPIQDLRIPWSVELRTSDTTSSTKTKQKNRLPTCLITTPESLSILLSYPKTHPQFSSVQLVVLDEWHELMGSKRGVQAELGLSRLRTLSPEVATWAVSATIGNVPEALQTAMGSSSIDDASTTVIKAPARRKLSMRSLIPPKMERFPWAGHLGLRSIESLIKTIEQCKSSLVFTNTRSQAERWYSAILHAKPEWAGRIGLHHGSMDREKRTWVERELDAGNLHCVVCTSSLDLGVDFFPVEQVLQVGSPKGIARLMQRAGRSGHFPGGKSQLVFVPTHALELVELAAAKDALKRNQIESRIPLINCLDVLAQHVVTLASGSVLDAAQLYNEVRTTHAFAQLTPIQWQWVLDFVQRGGESLRAYPDFQRVKQTEEGLVVADDKIAKRHRMSIGTISSDREVLVKFMKGGRLGTIEERFVSKLKPGDNFQFAGRVLKLVMIRDMTAWVRRSKGKVAAVPRWVGGRLPLSSELADAVRIKLGQASRGEYQGKEMRAIRPILELQQQWSEVPDENTLLIEQVKTRDGFHVFLFPFEGRLVNEGLAAILAWRLSQLKPMTLASTINDYGIELLSPTEPPLHQAIEEGLFSPHHLLQQIEKSMNATELSRRQFRDIARVAGLVFGGLPGQGKTSRQLQASSDMFFDVFLNYDPENLLLKQAKQEVLDQQLEQDRLAAAMERLAGCEVRLMHPPKPTPLAFPILIDRMRLRLSTEKLADRIARMTQQFENAAG